MFSFRTTPIAEQLDKCLNGGRLGVFCTQNCYDFYAEEFLWNILIKKGNKVKVFFPEDSYITPTECHIHFEREDLKDLDAVVVELQDVGARAFNYTKDVLQMMRTLHEEGMMIPLYVVDHVNPGERMAEGSFASKAKDETCFPHKHGLTLGEVVYFYANQIGAIYPIHVIAAYAKPGYGEFMPWAVTPSPDVPGLFTPQLYPGFELFNHTNITPGIGTSRPYESIGAPWVKVGSKATSYLPANPAVKMLPCSFTPAADLYEGKRCFGYQIVLTPSAPYHSVLHALSLLRYFKDEYPQDFRLNDDFEQALGDPYLMSYINGEVDFRDVLSYVKSCETKWARKVKKWLLY